MRLTIQKVDIESKKFPSLLKDIPQSPSHFFCKGSLDFERDVSVAVVGTRKATREGKVLAGRISEGLSRMGFVIVSGLALGVDAAAHEGALNAGGKTVAVLANGLDTVYPRQHKNLATRILEGGGSLVSLYPEGTLPYPNQFLERNCIISGLSIAAVVVEAPARSGSLVTAKSALEQGREVFVVPGPAGHPNYEGSHLLLRDGARLVTSAEEIIQDLEPVISASYPEFEKELHENTKGVKSSLKSLTDNHQEVIFGVIRESGVGLTIDKVVEMTNLEPHIANQSLTFLTLSGLVQENDGKFVVI